MGLLPWGVIEKALDLVILLLQGIPAEQRKAQWLAWWYAWWPVTKLWLSADQQKQIQDIMDKPAQ